MARESGKLIDKGSGRDLGSPRVKRSGLRFGTWGVNINLENGTFELYRANRPDLAHLTVLTKTRSREIDVHLTFGHEAAMSGLGEKTHEPLLRLKPDTLEQLGGAANDAAERIARTHLLSRYRRFRPGWLRRRGYLVSIVEREVVHAWLKRIVPHKKRKFYFDPTVAFNIENVPQELVEEVYDPGAEIGPS